MIAVPVGEDAKYQIRMLLPHVFNGVHDDVGIGVRGAGVDQDHPIFAGDKKGFDHASVSDRNSTRHDFHAVDRDIFQNADHVLAPLKISNLRFQISDFEI
jgi:hypothetical protein